MSNSLINKSDSLPLYEAFYAFQGEGSFIGTAAYFIRLYGCPVKCTWCDSPGTWNSLDKDGKSFVNTDVYLLVQNALESGAKIVVITGGEPAIYDLTALTTALVKSGLRVHLETCGAYPVRGHFDWITVSPKWAALPIPENLQKANELKLIVEDEFSVDEWWSFLEQFYTLSDPPEIWLQPEYNSLLIRRNLLNVITKIVKDNPSRYKAGIQLHKIYMCDDLDKNAR